jgi:hypothetical protein
MVILFLISNNESLLSGIMDFEPKRSKKSLVIYFLSITPIAIFFFSLAFFVIKKIPTLANKVHESKIEIEAKLANAAKNTEVDSPLSNASNQEQNFNTDSKFVKSAPKTIQDAELLKNNNLVAETELSSNKKTNPSTKFNIESNLNGRIDKNFNKFLEGFTADSALQNQINEREKLRLKDRLSENFLFKHFSDVVLIIVAQISILLLLSNKKNQAR